MLLNHCLYFYCVFSLVPLYASIREHYTGLAAKQFIADKISLSIVVVEF